MNRPLKFRYWDLRNKKFYTDDALYMTYQIDPLREVGKPHEKIIINQFTGILDKNNKEIYEDDIFENPFGWGENLFVSFYQDGNQMKWTLSRNINNPMSHQTHNLWDGKKFNVIGNIHENPELINKYD